MDDQGSTSTIGKKLADGLKLASVWDQFYGHCSTIIRSCPGVRRLPDADREDCVQDVMLELVRKFGERWTETSEDHLNGWIRLTSRNKAVDIVRRRYRKPEVQLDDGADRVIPGRECSGATTEEARGEDVSLIWEALLSLDHQVPVTSYLVFYLRAIEGWGITELADLFGITPEQVRFRCHRVKKKFRTILATKGRSRDEPRPD